MSLIVSALCLFIDRKMYSHSLGGPLTAPLVAAILSCVFCDLLQLEKVGRQVVNDKRVEESQYEPSTVPERTCTASILLHEAR